MAAEKSPLASSERPVPQTNSGGQAENTEAIERTVVKELGKMPPCNFGRRGAPYRQPTSWGSGGGRRDQ